ncbi:MAG TPA: hypothetical protein VM452_09545 [Caulifigura sp.]|nr:hypothetical protein [Caulifigura sp.]
MSKKKAAETGMDRLKALPLWQWGAILIFAGMVANAVMGLQPAPTSSAAARGQEFGRGAATLLFVLLGIGMMLWDFLRKKPDSPKKLRKLKHSAE